MDRPRARALRASAASRSSGSRRSATSGSTPGIVPFSTLGWQNPEWVEGGYATGAAKGLTHADLPDHAYWEQWYPADWVSEMREQIRLWFYSQLFMSVVITGKAPFRSVLGYEKMLDETGREMHGSWGNLIRAEEAFERMGADVMRYQFCAPAARPQPALRLRARRRRCGASCSRSGTRSRFLVDYANIEGWRPSYDDARVAGPAASCAPLDRWLVARADRLVTEARAALDAQLTHRLVDAFEAYLDDLSNWYIRRSRRALLGRTTRPRSRRSGTRVVQGLRVVAP